MSQLFLVGRLVVGAYFLFNAFNHFTQLGSMASYTASKGVPFPTAAVVGSGVLLAIAGVSFLLGVLPKMGMAAAVLFLVPVTFIMHRFWTVADPAARLGELGNFAKNLALLGATLMFAAIPEPWPYSVHVPAARPARAPATPAAQT